MPSRFIVSGWKDKTPDDFKFALKFSKVVTHEKKLAYTSLSYLEKNNLKPQGKKWEI
jgi:uncharacterized protein YecE (DUF72 family)